LLLAVRIFRSIEYLDNTYTVNLLSGVMVRALVSSEYDPWLCNCYLFILCYASKIKQQEQKLAGLESEKGVRMERYVYL